MNMSLLLMGEIGKMFLMILMGFAIVKSGLLSKNDSKVLSKITLYLVMPCMIIDSFQVDCTPDKVQGLILATVGALIVHALYIFVSGLLKRPMNLTGVERTSIIYGNAGNLIVPIVSSLFGKEYVLFTSGFMMVQTVLLFTHCRMTLGGKGSMSLRGILTNVNVIAIAIGLVLFATGLRFPAMICGALSAVGGCVGPISMIVTGMLLGGFSWDKLGNYKKLPLVLLFRLFIFPAMIMLIYRFTPMMRMVPEGDTVLLISFLAAAAPTASSVTQLSQVYGGDSEYAGLINMISTLLCILTMPMMIFLFQM